MAVEYHGKFVTNSEVMDNWVGQAKNSSSFKSLEDFFNQQCPGTKSTEKMEKQMKKQAEQMQRLTNVLETQTEELETLKRQMKEQTLLISAPPTVTEEEKL